MATKETKVKLVGDTSPYERSMRNVSARNKHITDTLKKHWVAFSVAAVAAVMALKKGINVMISTMRDWINVSGVQELAEISLAAALKAAGVYTEALNRKYQAFASSIQRVTKYGDEQVLGLMALIKNLGVSTNKVEEATKMAIGLATATNRDVKSMAQYVALAMQGEFTMLRRYIPALRSTTDATEQLKIVTDFAARGFKVAQEQTASFAIGLVQTKNLWGDLKEKLGDFIIKNKAVLSLMQKTKTWLIEVGEKVDAWRKKNQELVDQKVEEWINIVRDTILGLGKTLGWFYGVLKTTYDFWFKLENESLKQLGKKKKALEAEITQINLIKSAVENLPAINKALGADTEGSLRLNELQKQLDRTNYLIGLYTGKQKEAATGTEEAGKKVMELADKLREIAKQLTKETWENPLEEVFWMDLVQFAKDFEHNLGLINYELEIFRLNSVAAWEAYNKPVKEATGINTEALTAALRDMYSDMTGYGLEYNEQVFKLIDMQAKGYEELGIKQTLIDKWVTEEKKKRLDEQAQMTRDSLADTAGNWAAFFKYLGKENKAAFKAYKVMALAEAMINTYSSAIAAFKSAASLPVIGWILAPIAAAGAIAAGMANIAMIRAQTMHRGGIIGENRGQVRTVMPAVFDGAPKAHGGIGPGERPIIAKDDEGIFTPGQMAALGPAGGNSTQDNSITIIMQNPTFQDQNTQRQVFANIATQITERVAPGAVVRSYDNDGPIRSRVRSRA